MSYLGDSLVLTNITYRHAGKYFCVAGQSSIKGETRERAVHVQVLREYRISEVVKYPTLCFFGRLTTNEQKGENSIIK